MDMKPAPVGSFVRFLVGFLTFIGVSLGVTVAVNSYSIAQQEKAQQASAFQALLSQEQ